MRYQSPEKEETLSPIEVFANSTTDHGLAPLEAGGSHVPVFCTTWATVGTEILATALFGGTTSLVGDVGGLPSTTIPARGSARELLELRNGSVA